jgi:23S rRNA pseudouridine2605 synthase
MSSPSTRGRIQKVLAQAGLGSRRAIEDWIRAGRISLNGRAAQLGDQIKAGDRIKLDGRPVFLERLLPQETRVLALHKPVGLVCSRSDPEGRDTVFDTLPSAYRGRWVGIGRLDLNTSGLMLFTNDGELANQLMHPSREVEREYLVRVLGEVKPEVLDLLSTGVMLEDGPAKFDAIVPLRGEGANRLFRVVLKEGRNREVRRLWEAQGLKISRLSRIRYGTVSLTKDKRPGQWWELTSEEVEDLKRLLYPPEELPKPPDPPKPSKSRGTRAHAQRPSVPAKPLSTSDGPKRRRAPRRV